jgi:hypothetical protein
VRFGNVETTAGGRQVFAAVAKVDTDIAGLIRRDLETVGQSDETEVTAFTDGCSSLRCILADAGVTKPPILDWFHIAMRMQHAAQAASGLSMVGPDRVKAKAVIVAEVERLRWRIWNGNAAIARKACRHASYGAPCMKPIAISGGKVPGSSITLKDTVPSMSELRSPKAQRTSWSIGA